MVGKETLCWGFYGKKIIKLMLKKLPASTPTPPTMSFYLLCTSGEAGLALPDKDIGPANMGIQEAPGGTALGLHLLHHPPALQDTGSSLSWCDTEQP